jgi:hypothetical protein
MTFPPSVVAAKIIARNDPHRKGRIGTSLDRSNGQIELFCFKVLSLAETAYTRKVQRFNEAESRLVLSSHVHGVIAACNILIQAVGAQPVRRNCR